MANETEYAVDPMAAFYAAVTAVEEGKVKEIELEFHRETSDSETMVTMAIRKELRPTSVFIPIPPTGE